jgi:hypothetical protein
MHATPVVPGSIYHIRGAGLECNVLAAHGCDAILIGLSLAGVLQ